MGSIYARGSGAGGSSPVFSANCDSSVNLKDWVYILASGTNTVGKAIANDSEKVEVVGMVISKPTETSCIVQQGGIYSKHASLIKNKKIYLSDSSEGEIVYTPPTSSGSYIKNLGNTISETILSINIDQLSILNS